MQKAEDAAYARGRRDAALALTEIIDDCDRALEALKQLGADDAVYTGVLAARERMLSHLAALGLSPLVPAGEQFDPLFHEAIAVEPGRGTDGEIVKVHRRGWLDGELLARPAVVTVRQGTPAADEREHRSETVAETLEKQPRNEDDEIAFPRRRKRAQRGSSR